MKTFLLVAFAFVAVQLTLAAPAPEDEKKEEQAAVQEKSATPFHTAKEDLASHAGRDAPINATPESPAAAEKAH